MNHPYGRGDSRTGYGKVCKSFSGMVQRCIYMVVIWSGMVKEEVNALETTEERDSLLPRARPWVGGGASLLPLSTGNFGLFHVG